MGCCLYCLEDVDGQPDRCPHCDEPLSDAAEASLAPDRLIQRERDRRWAARRARSTLHYGIAALILTPLCIGFVFGLAAVAEGIAARRLFERLGEDPPVTIAAGMAMGGLGFLLSCGCVAAVLPMA